MVELYYIKGVQKQPFADVLQNSKRATRPCSFSKIGKKCPNLGKKCTDCGHLWVKFLI